MRLIITILFVGFLNFQVHAETCGITLQSDLQYSAKPDTEKVEIAWPKATENWPEAKNIKALGWQPEQLSAIRHTLDTLGTAAFIILTNGRVVMKYGDIDRNFNAHSVRKSFLSALYGIAVAKGRIDTSATLGELGISAKPPLTEQEKQATVADLLKAKSGVYLPSAAESEGMKERRPKRGSHPPGTYFYYNNWDFNALGTIYRQQTGRDIFKAFQEEIARPLGMQDYSPELGEYNYAKGRLHPQYAFRISTRDLARFGQMYMNEGRWNNKQIVPPDWVEYSTQLISKTGDIPGTKAVYGYGLLWWVVDSTENPVLSSVYQAAGYCGQYLTVVPTINTIIVHRINTAGAAEINGPCISIDDYRPVLFKILRARTNDSRSE